MRAIAKTAHSAEQNQVPAGLVLTTAFQPIFSLAHAVPVGHEALLRGIDERGRIGAGMALQSLSKHMGLEQVESVCARLHLKTFADKAPPGWLFLNLSPDVLPDRETVRREFGAWLEEVGLPGNRIVVEIVEKQARGERRLASAIEGFRDLGCLVAIDDFGAGESNFERIWRIRPDLVKLDREMLVEACEHPHVRQLLPGIVSLLHEAGCLVVLEGIETEEQALIALESDVDFVQGFLFSRPSEEPAVVGDHEAQFAKLTHQFRGSSSRLARKDEELFQFYTSHFQQCVRSLQAGKSLDAAAEPLMGIPGVQRLYLLDESGKQVGFNQEREQDSSKDRRYDTTLMAGGGDWSRRHYFQRAIARPAVVQMSRPYLSVRDAQRCVTLSLATKINQEIRVLCADLDHDPGSASKRS